LATEDEEVNSMPHDDDITDGWTPKYLPGFREAVRRLQGPKEGAWSRAHYTDEAAFEQALRQAYHEGRMDGITQALGRTGAPGADRIEEVPRLTLEEVWADLDLFEVVPGTTPQRISDVLAARPALPPLNGTSPHVWATRIAMEHLNMSLAEASEWAKEMTGR
jgi:hypothetical protein